MSLPRFFLTTAVRESSSPVALPLGAADVHHAATVLRLAPGDEVEVVGPDAAAWRVVLTQVGEEGLEGQVVERLQATSIPRITLVQGVAKGDKMDDIVRHAVEIGAADVLPVLTERSVVRLSPQKRAEKGERWRRIAKSAAEQSHRDEIPIVHDPIPLSEAIEVLTGYDAAVVLWEEADGRGLEAALSAAATDTEARIAIIVGPEGGFSEGEVSSMKKAGAQVASLGPGILRTETAALVALALAVHHFGGLGRV